MSAQPQNVAELQGLVLRGLRKVKLAIENNEPSRAHRQIQGLIEALEPKPTPRQSIRQVAGRFDDQVAGL
jgi:hypothetical protein